jgi:hypothetical protein
MSSYTIGPCGCCESAPCGAYCDAHSLSFKFISTASGEDTLRPCATPCSIEWSKEVPLQAGSGGMYMWEYFDRSKPWSANPTDASVISTGSDECDSASGSWGSYYLIKFPCHTRNDFRLSHSINAPYPESSNGQWRFENGVWVWYPVQGPGIVGNECAAVIPTVENGLCYNRTIITDSGQTTEEVCKPAVKYAQSYGSIGNFWSGGSIMESDFYTDSCEDFCGKTYTSNTEVLRAYSTKIEITFNCLP